jgi:transmembrane sensor
VSGVDSDTMIRAQAAAWLARLCSDERTPVDDCAFRAWLREDQRHQQAFDLVNTAWEIAGGELPNMPGPVKVVRPQRRYLMVGAIAGSFVVAVTVAMFFPRSEAFATGLGEQRRIALDDGSTLLLDTSTTAEVTLRPHRREIKLIKGRAHFEVAKDANRPFVVSVGKQQVVAVGTAFDVGLEGDRASVLLTHGKVVVEDPAGRRTMVPGDRLVFQSGGVIADKPDLESLTAWATGRTVFESRTLKSVVAELNRYSRRQLVIIDPAVQEMKLSGSYKLGDAEAFAISVSALLPVEAQVRRDQIILAARDSSARRP